MTISFRHIDVRSVARPVFASGVIKAEMLASADEARSIIEEAQHEAQRLLEEAQVRAEEELQQQHVDLEQQMWRQAASYSQAVSHEWDRSLTDLETRLTELVGRVMRRLLDEVPAEERVRACVQQLVSQADAPDTGVLMVAEEDHATVAPLAGTLPWPVQSSGEMSPGTVRLASKHGRWECDFGGALERVLQALGPSEPAHQELTPGEEDVHE